LYDDDLKPSLILEFLDSYSDDKVDLRYIFQEEIEVRTDDVKMKGKKT
jgi:hypothetical protein